MTGKTMDQMRAGDKVVTVNDDIFFTVRTVTSVSDTVVFTDDGGAFQITSGMAMHFSQVFDSVVRKWDGKVCWTVDDWKWFNDMGQ